MTIAEIVKQENEFADRVFLYGEGAFWKLYNQSALWWITQIQPLKISIRQVKYLNESIIMVGFPQKSWDKYAAMLAQKNIPPEVGDKRICLVCGHKPTMEQVAKEIANVKSVVMPTEEKPCRFAASEDILNEIRLFPLVRKTPIEAIEFIAHLQKELSYT